MLVGRIFRTLGMGLVRRDCSVRCITALYRPPRRYGAFFCFTPQCPVAQKCEVLACTSLQARPSRKRAGLANLNRAITGGSWHLKQGIEKESAVPLEIRGDVADRLGQTVNLRGLALRVHSEASRLEHDSARVGSVTLRASTAPR
jgi:hypothetical protein